MVLVVVVVVVVLVKAVVVVVAAVFHGQCSCFIAPCSTAPSSYL